MTEDKDMSEIKREQTAKRHSVSMQERESLTVNGVDDVVSFDEASIVLSTVCGILSVDGSGLRVVSLDTDSGSVQISGTINAMIYPESIGRGGLFRKKQK